jgi:uncharacterized protein (TIGR02118 family)
MAQAAFVEIAAGSNKARVLFGYGLNDLTNRSVKSSNLLAVRSNIMARLVVMYRAPKDFVAFDKHYFEAHVPIAKKIPGLRNYEVSQGPVATPGSPSDFHLIATLHFDDLAAIQRAFASAEGQAAAADVQTFATGGADMIFFDSREV